VIATWLAAVMIAPGCRPQAQSSPVPPIIDMHLHAHTLSMYGTPTPAVCTNDQDIFCPGLDPREPLTAERVKSCSKPLPAPSSDDELLN
jgi:hypothetical protein